MEEGQEISISCPSLINLQNRTFKKTVNENYYLAIKLKRFCFNLKSL